ncbi:VWA domain-containing protein [Bacteroidales bacterium]|nr:VWA domain-containing protein [Bacteroidales bacterium]
MKKIKLIIWIALLVNTLFTEAKLITVNIYDIHNAPIQGAQVISKRTGVYVNSDANGFISMEVQKGDIIKISKIGFVKYQLSITEKNHYKIQLIKKDAQKDIDMPEIALYEENIADMSRVSAPKRQANAMMMMKSAPYPYRIPSQNQQFNTEGYATIHENGYKNTMSEPLSTFSIDVDAASYSNMRRFIMNGSRPQKDVVRIEEMINYFNYNYDEPKTQHPFSINVELGNCPWNEKTQLLHIGLQGKRIDMHELPTSNIVFLLDVSGSMNSPNKLPLLKKSFKLLIQELRPEDKVAIVVYAGSSGLVLPSTSCENKNVILQALEKLNAGGSTAGSEGLKLAYKVASENFIEGGNNRIILATDGDFNVGQSSNAEMERLIEKEREKGVYISALGFGMGNYKDSKMEIIADKGNGNYAYIDNLMEAKKVLVNEFGGTLHTIAKDVKIQVEFNPAIIEEYRLVGYENRLLNNEDFNDDKKDAGELGSGHTVTALYEIKLANSTNKERTLKYQKTNISNKAKNSNELATIKFRYKKPDSVKSILLEEIVPNKPINTNNLSNNFRFSASVAGFGLLLRDSEYKANCSYPLIKKLAQDAKGEDAEGYRSEFIRLVGLAEKL